jgi:hypothetical protein
MKIAANPQQHSPRTYRRKTIVSQTVIGVDQILHAISLAQEFSTIERIDEYFRSAGLMAANEMARQSDSRHRQAQSPRQQHVKQA